MAGLTTAGLNALLDSGLDAFATASLHSSDPGATGLAEISGGSPAYARKAITWAAATGAGRTTNVTPLFDVPASTVAYVGYWSGATFLGSRALSATEVYAAQGTYLLSAITELLLLTTIGEP